jgi:hypothetical protein
MGDVLRTIIFAVYKPRQPCQGNLSSPIELDWHNNDKKPI